MIGRLVGKVVETGDSSVVLDVSGVGYDVWLPQGTLGRAASLGVSTSNTEASTPEVTLIIHTHVRQDSLDLFGFASETERSVFRLLLTTPNVGPKMAVHILSVLPPAELAVAVANEDVAQLRKISGIGKKKAELILLQLRDKLPEVSASPQTTATAPTSNDAERIVGALTNMGYRSQQADRAVAALKGRLGKEPLANLLKAALAELA